MCCHRPLLTPIVAAAPPSPSSIHSDLPFPYSGFPSPISPPVVIAPHRPVTTAPSIATVVLANSPPPPGFPSRRQSICYSMRPLYRFRPHPVVPITHPSVVCYRRPLLLTSWPDCFPLPYSNQLPLPHSFLFCRRHQQPSRALCYSYKAPACPHCHRAAATSAGAPLSPLSPGRGQEPHRSPSPLRLSRRFLRCPALSSLLKSR
ncbi:hypothetical protein NL676_018333 [Syzygium grande]|nr:hypothetical protein NL676_018333 [Syzygium grande]